MKAIWIPSLDGSASRPIPSLKVGNPSRKLDVGSLQVRHPRTRPANQLKLDASVAMGMGEGMINSLCQLAQQPVAVRGQFRRPGKWRRQSTRSVSARLSLLTRLCIWKRVLCLLRERKCLGDIAGGVTSMLIDIRVVDTDYSSSSSTTKLYISRFDGRWS